MAKKRGRSLGYMTIQRFVVTGCGPKKVYTSVVDAMVSARRCSRNPDVHGLPRRANVLYGLPGAEARIAICEDRKCKTPGGQAVPMRKLYDMEQRGPAAAAFDETARSKRKKSSRVPAKARKTKPKKKTLPKWKRELIARAKARKAA